MTELPLSHLAWLITPVVQARMVSASALTCRESLNVIAFRPETMFPAAAPRLLPKRVYDCPSLLGDLYHHFSAMIRRAHQRDESVTTQHLNLIKRLDIQTVGCSICVLRVPVRQLSCQHWLCEHCARRICFGTVTPGPTIRNCPICKETNLEDVHITPPMSGIRVLTLDGSERLVSRYLFDIRQILFGPLDDYFDLVVAYENGQCHLLGQIPHHANTE